MKRLSQARLLRWLLVPALAVVVACEGDSTGPTRDGPTPKPNNQHPGVQNPSVQTPGGNTPTTPEELPPPESFESDHPGASRAGGGFADAGASAFGATSAPAADLASAERGSSAAERAIVEADIIQTAGNRLYALSRVAGLSVIDLTDPAKLSVLGRYRDLSGTPFEMYLRDGVAVVMFSGWGQYAQQADGNYKYVQTSKVVALDVQNPAQITTLGTFDVPGDVSDSRVVGDVLYVVGHQNGYCWGCTQNKTVTSVLSLNIANPRAMRKVDELDFQLGASSWGKRSISVTTQRIYVGGPEYDYQNNQPTGSSIQVVDISDPAGDLVAGTSIRVAGQITNRWQMDEYQGTLRVVSQPWRNWNLAQNVAPTVQTYSVRSSQQLVKLGELALVIPPNDTLQSVRFDGTRGYAITAEVIDPLITIDLSNPALPRQVGELKIPGFIVHMEPRGNRLLGLGFDRGNPQGGVAVSLFDVTNLANPRELSRVNFGGSWASLPEDQDRLHKVFRVLDAQKTILVPFSGWSGWSDIGHCSSNYRSGVQLLDFADDKLTVRGVAPSRGQARRAISHGEYLLTVSDEAVDTFSMNNRDTLPSVGRLTIARNVNQVLSLGDDRAIRVNQDWYNNSSTLDVVRLNDVERADVSLGELDLSQALKDADGCTTNAWIQRAYATGTQVEIEYSRWRYTSSHYEQQSGLLIVDASSNQPRVLSKLEWQTATSGQYWSSFYAYDYYGAYGAGESVVRAGKALALLEQHTHYTANYQTDWREVRLRVIDLTDPAKPTETTLLLPKVDSYGGLVADGNNVMLSHYEENAETGRVRFYLDRVDLSAPKQPKLLPKENIPGVLLHQDREQGRALTMELVRKELPNFNADECYKRFAQASFIYPNNDYTQTTGTCLGYTQRLSLIRFVPGGAVLNDKHELGERDQITSSSFDAGRVAAIISHGYNGYYGYGLPYYGGCRSCDYAYGYASSTEPAELAVLAGFDTGTLVVGRAVVTDSNTNTPWWGCWGSPRLYAAGHRALVLSNDDAAIVDISDAAQPKLLRTVPMYASYARHVTMHGTTALLALGLNGVQRIDL